MRKALWICLLPFAAVGTAQEVSVRTLLPQMTDMTWLTRRPKPAFTMAQASSYDRASNPGPHQNPLANGDAGQFVRVEQNGGRTEQVMADLKGPGAVVRVWSANPHGTIRFYFDGEAKPRIETKMADLLTGKFAPFVDPFAYTAAQGTDLYFPLPYAKSLKVTAEGTRGLYYHVGYRTYAAGTNVQTFSFEDVQRNRALVQKIAAQLNGKAAEKPATLTLKANTNVLAGKSAQWPLQANGGVIQTLQVRVPLPLVRRPLAGWDDPMQPHQILRRLLLTISFDGETTVRTPLADFFGSYPGISPLATLPFQVKGDGTMTCRFPMPFRKSAVVRIDNTNTFTVPIEVSASGAHRPFGKDSYLFHAQWTGERGSTRPMKDMEMLAVTGEGMWVGCNLTVSNPTPAWWGEGDEKAYVDGEDFPSTFGTGTEDFFGYAWGSPQLFTRPYHAQPHCDGPGTFGHTIVERFQTFDPIPFRRSLRFDLEKWHWEDVDATFTRTAYWYARPGTTGPKAIDTSLLEVREMKPPAPVKGAIEGESLTVVSKTGGEKQEQEGFWELSGGKQLWWTGVGVGDRLVLKVPVKEPGTYEVIGNFCHARDYGIHRLTLNGQKGPELDFFGTGVDWKKISLGTFTLPKGDVLLEVECVGNRAEAAPGRLFGLDYLLLQKK